MVETSIIIRTRNEQNNLRRLLDMIKKQRYKNFEIIIVDNESSDNTRKVAKKFRTKIVTIKKRDFSYGRAINFGCRHAKAKYIVLVSGHALPSNNSWLGELIKPLKKHTKIVGTYSRQTPMPDAYHFIYRDMKRTYPTTVFNKVIKFSNVSSAFSKDAWKDIPFDEVLTGSEDIRWANRWKENQIKYCPKSVIHHSHNETYAKAKKRSNREALANFEIGEVKLSISAFIFVILANMKNLLKDLCYFLMFHDNFFQFKKAVIFRIANISGFYNAYKTKK